MTAVEEALSEFVSRMFVGPVWPASILVCLMVLYTLVAMIGLIDLDFDAPDIDLDVDVSIDVGTPEVTTPDLDATAFDVAGGDADVDLGEPSGIEFVSGIAATTIRWTNFGRVPLVIWLGAFTVVFWSVSYGLWHGFDSDTYQPNWIPSILLGVRNAVLATVITKYLTQPAVGKFSPAIGYDKERLLGATCEISTITASPTFGQAKFRTNAAPLLLNVRTNGPEIPKGTEVRIVDFDQIKRIYTVTEIQLENES